MLEPEQLPYEVLDLLARACYRNTVSVFWGVPDQEPGTNSASGVLLNLNRPLLITAKHVVDTYLQRQRDDISLEFQIGLGFLPDVASRLVEASHPVDLITLDLSDIDVRGFADHLEFHHPITWPPERVRVDSHVILSGYPKPYRRYIHMEKAIDFKSWHLHSRVHGTTEDRFSCVVNVDVARSNRPRGNWPETYGALSGGPAFTVRGNVQKMEIGGIIYQASDGFNIIEAHHADLIAI
jgi:hypothetical protein